jgi:hypothetical protein
MAGSPRKLSEGKSIDK